MRSVGRSCQCVEHRVALERRERRIDDQSARPSSIDPNCLLHEVQSRVTAATMEFYLCQAYKTVCYVGVVAAEGSLYPGEGIAP
jgi:hypothetical protein